MSQDVLFFSSFKINCEHIETLMNLFGAYSLMNQVYNE